MANQIKSTVFDSSEQSTVVGTEMCKGVRGGFVLEAHRLLYHSTLGLRVIKKKKWWWPGLRIRGSERESGKVRERESERVGE